MADLGGAPDPREVDELFGEYLADGRRATRNRIVELHMGLAAAIAGRFARSRPGDDDLEQVALLGLVKAVERFDPSRGVAFATFASRTVEGELKRHFRDATWDVRVPRSLKELHVSIGMVTEELTQRLGHSPSVRDVAAELGASVDDVVAAIGAGATRSSEPLDPGPGLDQDRQAALASGGGFEGVEQRALLDSLMASVAPREREILRLRFGEQLSQDAIAARLGISQMHVSRLLRRTLDQLRAAASEESSGTDV